MTNEDFWNIAKSPEFINKFGGEHPLYKDNGGAEFYNTKSLQELRKCYQESLLKQSAGRNRWVYRKSLEVVNSWIKQVQWIEENA